MKDEVAPVEIKSRKGVTLVEQDDHMRPDTTMEILAKLPTVFKKDGVVTAGNASGIVDGAAALVIAGEDAVKARGAKPLGRIVSWATVGVEPTIMGMGPAPAIRKALERARLALRRSRPDRDQRGVRGAIPGVREGARPRSREGQRQRRRDRDRPPARRQRRADRADAAARAAAARQEVWRRVRLHRRRSGNSDDCRGAVGREKRRTNRKMAIKTVGVLGCGLMGAGIAQVSAAAGFKTIVLEVNEDVLKKGLGRIEKFLTGGVEKGKVTEEQKTDRARQSHRHDQVRRPEGLRPRDRSDHRERRDQEAGLRAGRGRGRARTA